MERRIESLKDYIYRREHHAFRHAALADKEALAKEWAAAGIAPMERALRRFRWMLGEEAKRPVLLPGARIAFMRTQSVLAELFTAEEWEQIRKTHSVCELGRVFNINGDYAMLLKEGFGGRRAAAHRRLQEVCTEEECRYLETSIACVDAIYMLADAYAEAAEAAGDVTLAAILRRVPREGAKTLREALQLARIAQYCLWCAGHYHNTWGRFDQYMLPYYEADRAAGASEAECFSLIEEFFLMLNVDADLYVGMQQGDNGQSMVLGGQDKDGKNACNDLTRMALRASLELKLIDPKINLRVDKDTPMELYRLGTELTKEGLGFPQYSNDDVAIQALTDWGYALEDARDYVVAACWELIVPGKGLDVVNIGALSLAQCVRESLLEDIARCADMDAFKAALQRRIRRICEGYPAQFANLYMEPAPVYSLFMEGCVERARDCALGLRYNNYGIHGTGLASAADAMAAVERLVFEEKRVSPERLCAALENDFAEDMELHAMLLDCPKCGNDDDAADRFLCFLTEAFAAGLEGLRNDRGGLFRPGTGSAMFYVTHGEELGATADGRRKGAWLSANYSPALEVRPKGPVSVVRSFTKPALAKVCNGGPLTIELHDTLFGDANGLDSVAKLVRLFIVRGGHQIQLNTINRERLYAAQRNPEAYRSLIVRVWGWSGYFVELDKVYQDHIIERVEFSA